MTERDYVLGTHDEEIARLALQHRVWRPHVRDAWQQAGLAAGQTALDVGCGPGWATLDLAEAVGPRGRVVAVDQSERFLDHLRARNSQVEVAARNLSVEPLPELAADLAWCRWIFAFVADPRGLLARVRAALRPGGAVVIHEYFDYAAWRMLPRCSELEEFVAAVMQAWRDDGGEPDVGANLAAWAAEDDFTVEAVRPLVFLPAPGEPMWEWPIAFVRTGLARLVALGRLPAARAADLDASIAAAATRPGVRLCTPAVVELIARRAR
jgi:SAM-dependent methyltransferase